jgi:hypothetical protein
LAGLRRGRGGGVGGVQQLGLSRAHIITGACSGGAERRDGCRVRYWIGMAVLGEGVFSAAGQGRRE